MLVKYFGVTAPLSVAEEALLELANDDLKSSILDYGNWMELPKEEASLDK